MTDYSVAEAKAKLSELIERAQQGEGVVITNHGRPVAEIKPVGRKKPGPLTKADLEWLKQNRVGGRMPKVDAATLISRMRDEDWT